MPDFQLNYSGEQVNTAIGNGLNAITTESGQVLTTDQQQVVQQKIGLPKLFSHTAPPIIETVNGSVVSVVDASDQNAVSLISRIDPVQDGSGEPSPDNVRPISGWNDAKATRAGKNIAPDVYSDYSTATAYAAYTVNPQKLPIVMSFTDKDTAVDVSGLSIGLIDDVYNPSGNYKWCLANGVLQTPVTTQTYRNIFIHPKTEAAFNKIFSRYNVQVEFGTTATAYEPYESQTLTSELPETVYGGSLDWGTGVLTVDRKQAQIDFVTELYTSVADGYIGGYIRQSDMLANSRDNGLCDKLIPVYTPANASKSCIVFGANNDSIYIVLPTNLAGTTLETMNAYLTENPLTVVYPLAEPYTIQLTPQQLGMLKGTNNVWSNTGDTELSYVADTKLYINKQIASVATTEQNS